VHISQLRSHDVNVKSVRDRLAAPALSFDLSQARGGSDSDGESEEGIEVSAPVGSRRAFLKEKLQRNVSRHLAEKLVSK